MANALISPPQPFSDAAAVAEMLRRTTDAKRAIGAELRKLREALSPAPEQPTAARGKSKAPPPAPSSAKRPEPAADPETVKERKERIGLIVPELRSLRSTENDIFTQVRKELDSRGPNVIRIIYALNRLDTLYTQWDPLVEQLRAVFRESGEQGSQADQYRPDRKTRDQINSHPVLTRYRGL